LTKNFIWQPTKNIGTGRLDKNENYCSVCRGFGGKNSFSPAAAYLSEARIKVLAEGKVLISPQPSMLI